MLAPSVTSLHRQRSYQHRGNVCHRLPMLVFCIHKYQHLCTSAPSKQWSTKHSCDENCLHWIGLTSRSTYLVPEVHNLPQYCFKGPNWTVNSMSPLVVCGLLPSGPVVTSLVKHRNMKLNMAWVSWKRTMSTKMLHYERHKYNTKANGKSKVTPGI